MEDPPNQNSQKMDQALALAAANPISEDYWDALFIPLRTSLTRRVRFHGLASNLGDTLDIVDETILRVYRYYKFSKLAALAPEARSRSFHSFIGKALLSVVYTQWRKEHVRTSADQAARHPILPPGSSIRIVTEAVHALKESDQRLLKLKVVEHKTYAEISEIFRIEGITINAAAVKTRYLRAINYLKREIAKRRGE